MRRDRGEVHVHVSTSLGDCVLYAVLHVLKLPVTAIPAALVYQVRVLLAVGSRQGRGAVLRLRHLGYRLLVHSRCSLLPRDLLTRRQVAPL